MHERAAAILEAIKALPAEERTAFTRLFHDWEGASGEVAQQEAGTEWPDFAGRMKAIFGERVISGDPQDFWDEERGR